MKEIYSKLQQTIQELEIAKSLKAAENADQLSLDYWLVDRALTRLLSMVPAKEVDDGK